MTGTTAEELRRLLDLEPHPTCGFVAMTHLSPDRLVAGFPAAAADLAEFLDRH